MCANILIAEIYNEISKFGMLLMTYLMKGGILKMVNVRARTEQEKFYEGGIWVSAKQKQNCCIIGFDETGQRLGVASPTADRQMYV